MARYGAVLNFSGPFPDGDGIHDLTARVSKDTRVLRAAYAALGSQVPQQLFFQHSSRLNESASVNGLVGHTHALVIGILDFQPPGNLLRRPIQHSVYSQPPSATSHGSQLGTAWAAKPIPRPGNRLPWLDTQDGLHDVRPPGSLSTQLDPGV